MKGQRSRWLRAITRSLLFFVLIAFTIQIAVLAYDYIVERTQNNGLIALLMLIVIVILSALCVLVDTLRRRHTIERPLLEILDATKRIATGDFSVRLDVKHPYGKYTDFDVIMENVNTLAAELGKSEVLKTDFISNVSHELKTPLAVIKNYAELLKRDDLDGETRAKYAQTLQRAALRLSDLVTDILKLNKLENQEIKPEFQTFSLTEALAQAVIAYEDIAERKGLTFDCDLEEVTLYSAPDLLELVWNNLLSNAVKFTESDGVVRVRVRTHGKQAIVEVSDSGCGISPETGAHIFEKFYQGDTSHSGEGNGLGLPLVKKVIDILGGEISVQSEKNKGSTFTVALQGVIYA